MATNPLLALLGLPEPMQAGAQVMADRARLGMENPVQAAINQLLIQNQTPNVPQLPLPDEASPADRKRAIAADALSAIAQAFGRASGRGSPQPINAVDAIRQLQERRRQVQSQNELLQSQAREGQQQRGQDLLLKGAELEQGDRRFRAEQEARAAERADEKQFRLEMADKQIQNERDLAEYKAAVDLEIAKMRSGGRSNPIFESGIEAVKAAQGALIDALSSGEVPDRESMKRQYMLGIRSQLVGVPAEQKRLLLQDAEIFFEDAFPATGAQSPTEKGSVIASAPILATGVSLSDLGSAASYDLENFGSFLRRILGGDERIKSDLEKARGGN